MVLAGIFSLVSCGNRALYDEQVDIENGKWYKDDAAHFTVSVPDSTKEYDFYTIIRHITNYRYSNLYVFLTTKFPNGNYTRDTLEFILANDEGKWLGKGWSNIKEDNILLNRNMRFPLSGDYEFYVQQAMRHDTLKGIVSVGIRIVESQ
jgi:gliding motility-associated lipoprotein GldH